MNSEIIRGLPLEFLDGSFGRADLEVVAVELED